MSMCVCVCVHMFLVQVYRWGHGQNIVVEGTRHHSEDI